uniref:Nuclear transport factor 2 family protein n=1 Tax=Roseihalotalea indica TaxID=2867963 RepID=A0AA49GU52_9BACT|nr:nuclear transport factor 2 family protein [Tunicatimonas sp. TK19036]
MIEHNKATLKKANEAVAKGDHEGFLKFCTDDTHWTFVGDQVLQGKEAVRQWMATTYLQPPKFDIKNLIAENDFVTAIGNITMTDDDGKATHYSYCDVWRFRDGKMAELLAFVVEPKKSESKVS